MICVSARHEAIATALAPTADPSHFTSLAHIAKALADSLPPCPIAFHRDEAAGPPPFSWAAAATADEGGGRTAGTKSPRNISTFSTAAAYTSHPGPLLSLPAPTKRFPALLADWRGVDRGPPPTLAGDDAPASALSRGPPPSRLFLRSIPPLLRSPTPAVAASARLLPWSGPFELRVASSPFFWSPRLRCCVSMRRLALTSRHPPPLCRLPPPPLLFPLGNRKLL